MPEPTRDALGLTPEEAALEAQVWDSPIAPAVTTDGRKSNSFELSPTIIETHDPLLSGPSVQAVQSATDGSPSEVERQEIALRLRHAHLAEQIPILKAAEKRTVEDRKVAEAEQVQILRLLRLHERIKAPIRRKR